MHTLLVSNNLLSLLITLIELGTGRFCLCVHSREARHVMTQHIKQKKQNLIIKHISIKFHYTLHICTMLYKSNTALVLQINHFYVQHICMDHLLFMPTLNYILLLAKSL